MLKTNTIVLKILYIALLASVVSLTLFNAISTSSVTAEEASQKLLEYKLKYAVACGTRNQAAYLNFSGFVLTSPFLTAWATYYSPFTPPVDLPYNTLWIPDTLSGTTFDLRMHDTTKQFLSGNLTRTMAFNNNSLLGPTLIFKKGTTVQMHVKNDLADTSTVHWHGIHLPAVMDGGPHQPILPGTTWNPTWVVKNNAATYWYHPHLHMKTAEQMIMGLAGMIIVRDDEEAALDLPRTYGVDDIPLILQDKVFTSPDNQIQIEDYGDTMMCNGTLKAQYNVPAQVVRFRVLNAATDRSYNLGFSDNRDFSVIASDAGLLDNPVPVGRYMISAGERIEILVDFSGQETNNVALKAFNSFLGSDLPGSEPNNETTMDYLRNKLGNKDFEILKLNIVAKNANAVTAIPASLVHNVLLDKETSSITRTIQMTQANPALCPESQPRCSWFNGKFFDINRIDYEVQKDETEVWELINTSGTAHPFHIHDVSFNIISKSNGILADYEKGWKDVVMVRGGSSVRFIAKFEDYSDAEHPYMYHCHIAFHEDAGMMGQFLVLPGALPVTVTNFNAVLSGKNTILSWNTANELNTKTYSIERSTNGVHFNSAGIVNAAGKASYSFTDRDVTSLTGNLYYRLKIADADGKFVYSKTVNIKLSEISISLFPNPIASGDLNVSISPAMENMAQLKVVDSKGKNVITKTFAAGIQSFKVDVSTLSNGMYFLIISDGKKVKKQKFEVLRK